MLRDINMQGTLHHNQSAPITDAFDNWGLIQSIPKIIHTHFQIITR
jgi:hypothetical protein